MEKIVALGEILLRLTPPDYAKIDQTRSFMANYGGAESNVAVSLAYLGHKCYFISKLPDTEVGDSAIKHLRSHNVNADYVVRGSSLMGIYFYESGFGGRPSKVIYNRRHSAFTRIKVSEFDFDEIFHDATWFHLSGITLALNKSVREVTYKCLEYCKKYNVPVSFDFNFRSKLWTVEEAKSVYHKVIPYVDYLFASYWDANTMLDIEPTIETNDLIEKRNNVMHQLIEKYDITAVFSTDRTVYSATENSIKAYVVTKDEEYHSQDYRFQILDRIGAGDAFASGVIHCLIKDKNDFAHAVDFGIVTNVLKHTISGDASRLKEEDIYAYLAGCKGVIR